MARRALLLITLAEALARMVLAPATRVAPAKELVVRVALLVVTRALATLALEILTAPRLRHQKLSLHRSLRLSRAPRLRHLRPLHLSQRLRHLQLLRTSPQAL